MQYMLQNMCLAFFLGTSIVSGGLSGCGFNIMCEGDDPQTTNCTNILNITYANYGRTSSEVCPHRKMSDTNCYEPNSLAIVLDMCELGGQCTFTPANGVFGDPCRGTYKYLEIRYECGNNVQINNLDADITVSSDILVNETIFHLTTDKDDSTEEIWRNIRLQMASSSSYFKLSGRNVQVAACLAAGVAHDLEFHIEHDRSCGSGILTVSVEGITPQFSVPTEKTIGITSTDLTSNEVTALDIAITNSGSCTSFTCEVMCINYNQTFSFSAGTNTVKTRVASLLYHKTYQLQVTCYDTEAKDQTSVTASCNVIFTIPTTTTTTMKTTTTTATTSTTTTPATTPTTTTVPTATTTPTTTATPTTTTPTTTATPTTTTPTTTATPTTTTPTTTATPTTTTPTMITTPTTTTSTMTTTPITTTPTMTTTPTTTTTPRTATPMRKTTSKTTTSTTLKTKTTTTTTTTPTTTKMPTKTTTPTTTLPMTSTPTKITTSTTPTSPTTATPTTTTMSTTTTGISSTTSTLISTTLPTVTSSTKTIIPTTVTTTVSPATTKRPTTTTLSTTTTSTSTTSQPTITTPKTTISRSLTASQTMPITTPTTTLTSTAIAIVTNPSTFIFKPTSTTSPVQTITTMTSTTLTKTATTPALRTTPSASTQKTTVRTMTTSIDLSTTTRTALTRTTPSTKTAMGTMPTTKITIPTTIKMSNITTIPTTIIISITTALPTTALVIEEENANTGGFFDDASKTAAVASVGALAVIVSSGLLIYKLASRCCRIPQGFGRKREDDSDDADDNDRERNNRSPSVCWDRTDSPISTSPRTNLISRRGSRSMDYMTPVEVTDLNFV